MGSKALAGRHSILKLVRQPNTLGLPPHRSLSRGMQQAETGVRRGRLADLESSSLHEFVSTGLSVFTIQVMADTTPAASSFFTRARTKLGLSYKRRQLRNP